MARFLVLAAYPSSYTSKITGELVNQFTIEYFDSQSLNRSHDHRGFEILTREVSGDGFSESDFPIVPAFYDLLFRQEPRAQKKGVSSLRKVIFEKPAKLPECSNDEAYLVLRAQKWNFKDDAGKLIKGTTITYVDPFGVDGLRMIKNFVPANILDFQEFEYVPAYYLLKTQEKSGKYGRATSVIVSAEFVQSLNTVIEATAA
jgi:hypothetical protein